MQHDFVSKNIVAQTIISPAHSPLSFAAFQASGLLDFVPSATVVGIIAKNLNQFFEGADQTGVSLLIARNSRSKAGVLRIRNFSGMTSNLLLLAFAARSLQFSQE